MVTEVVGRAGAESGFGKPRPNLAKLRGYFGFLGGGGVFAAATQGQEQNQQQENCRRADEDRLGNFEAFLGLDLDKFLPALRVFYRALGVGVGGAMKAVFVIEVDRFFFVGQWTLAEVVAPVTLCVS